jgi:sporulation protein YlmC with PRC-barrel domain
MQLVRDLLDKAVVDRNGREMGRVDRVVVERGSGSPARVVAIEIGPSALAERLGRSLGRWIMGLLHGLDVDEGQPLRVHVSQILGVTDRVKVDLAFGETPAASMEHKLRGLVKRIPGANR